MEKITIELKPVEPIEISVGGKIIKVEQYINETIQRNLIMFYVDTYFSGESFDNITPKPSFNYLGAEKVLHLAMIDLLTNVDHTTLDYDLFIAHDGFSKMFYNIENYEEFRSDLNRVVSIIEKQLELSQTITTFKEQLYTFLAELPTKFDVEGMKTQLSSLATELKDSPLSPLLAESVKQPKPKTIKTKIKKVE